MVTIRIADHVKQASTYDDGQVIFNLIADKLGKDDQVAVSFEGIQAVPSAFVNAAFLQLLEVATLDTIRRKLSIQDSTKFINDLIRSRFEFVANQH
ncbi:MAG: STAS-like domain-containing protein [Rhodoferax sp.]|nr:STAS-like domain-containing protein [Rhodoferax sp.]